MKRVRYLLIPFMVFCSWAGFAQSNSFLDTVLNDEPLSYSKAAYLVLTAAGTIKESAKEDEAIAVFKTLGIELKLAPTDPVNLGQYSLLVMKAFKIGGGLFYTMTSGPRYAYKEFVYLGYILEPRSYPGKIVSGNVAVGILSRVLNERGGEA